MGRVARSVQFREIKDVVEAYVAYRVCFFAVWAGPDLLFPYDEDGATIDEGADLLNGLCEKLKDSAQIYTLKVYNKVPAGEIDEKTPCRASFNFQLHRIRDDQGEYLQNYSRESVALSRVAALELEIKKMKEEEQEEGEYDSSDTLGQISGILNHPLTRQLAGMFMPMLGAALGGNNNSEPKKIATMSGVPEQSNKTEDQLVNDAVATLRANDPALGAHLTKLAAIAVNDPGSFKMFLTMLDNL